MRCKVISWTAGLRIMCGDGLFPMGIPFPDSWGLENEGRETGAGRGRAAKNKARMGQTSPGPAGLGQPAPASNPKPWATPSPHPLLVVVWGLAQTRVWRNKRWQANWLICSKDFKKTTQIRHTGPDSRKSTTWWRTSKGGGQLADRWSNCCWLHQASLPLLIDSDWEGCS